LEPRARVRTRTHTLIGTTSERGSQHGTVAVVPQWRRAAIARRGDDKERSRVLTECRLCSLDRVAEQEDEGRACHAPVAIHLGQSIRSLIEMENCIAAVEKGIVWGGIEGGDAARWKALRVMLQAAAPATTSRGLEEMVLLLIRKQVVVCLLSERKSSGKAPLIEELRTQ
jgi:hypothetical protein